MAPRPPTPPAPSDTEEAALSALDSEALTFRKDSEIARILSAFRLDAYAVLDLSPGVPDTQIKAQYRSLSLLIHPDKTSNPSAPDAFDRLKKASSDLLDEKSRERLDEAIADARMLLLRDRKLTVDSPEAKNMAEDAGMKEAWRRKTVEVLVDAEARRRRQAKAQMQEEGREQRKEEEEVEMRKRKREFESKWESTREGRIDSWRDFKGGLGKGGGGGGGEGKVEGGKGKKKKMKVLG